MPLMLRQQDSPAGVRWLDINNSRWQNQQTVDGGGTLELKTPGNGQWAVLIERPKD